MIRRSSLVLLLLLCSLLTVHAQEQTVVGPDTYPEGINPLTGLPVDNPAVFERRPLNIKITNWPPEVRPQSGINQADIVWEHLVEGGVTRFTAVFYSQSVPHLGPVRSARLVDLQLTRLYNSLFVHSGSSTGTLDRLRSDAVMPSRNFGGGGCPPLCRFPQEGVAQEHTLFTNTEDLYQRANEIGLDVEAEPIQGMAFSAAVPAGGIELDGVHITYRQTEVQWAYDAASGNWMRSQDDVPHFDASTETQVQAANVALIETDHIEQPVISEGYWGSANYAFEVDLTGSGRIYLLRDGQYFVGQWQRADDRSPLTFVDMQGNTLPFKPGNTFFNLVPRWADGYQLVFFLTNPVNATVREPSVILRSGPNAAYSQRGVASQGDELTLVGRNATGDWVQVLQNSGDVLWVSAALLNVNGAEISMLPVPRSTFER